MPEVVAKVREVKHDPTNAKPRAAHHITFLVQLNISLCNLRLGD